MNSTSAERRTMLILGGIVAVIAIIMIIVCLKVPVLHDVVEDIGYPTISMSTAATEEISDNNLLKKKIGIGPFVMKMFSGSEDELGSAEYRATIDNMKVFVNFGAENSNSEELYNLYGELLGIGDIEKLRESSRILTLAEGFINKHDCDYRVFECGNNGNILMLETYIEDGSCYFILGLAYSEDIVTEEQLNKAIQYLRDAMTTLEFNGGYNAASDENVSPEESRKALEKALQDEEEYQSMLASMTEEEREEYSKQLLEKVNDVSDGIEYVDYGEEGDDYEEGTEFSYQIYTEKVLPLDKMYLVIEHLYASGEHSAKLVGMSCEEYEPVFRGIIPEEGKEINIFEITKEQCGGYYEFITDSPEMVVDTYTVTDNLDIATHWDGLTYDEYVKELLKDNNAG